MTMRPRVPANARRSRRAVVQLCTLASVAALVGACTKGQEPEKTEPLPALPRSFDLWDGVPPLVSEAGDVALELRPQEGPQPPPSVSERIELPFPPPSEAGEAPPPVAAGPLAVLRRSPEGGEGIFSSVSVAFNQPMVPLASVDQLRQEAVPISIEPAPPGKVRWLGTQALAFEAEGRFPFSTTYTVSVPAGTSSTLGGVLEKEVRWTFSTPTLALESSYPASGEGEALLDAPIVLRFNQAVRADELLAAGLELRGGGGAIALVPVPESGWGSLEGAARAEAEREPRARVMVLRPKERLQPDTRYTVTIPAGAFGEGPNAAKVQSFTFSTYPPLAIRGAECPSEGCNPRYGIWLATTTPLQADPKLAERVHISPEVEGFAVDDGGGGLHLSGRFEGSTTYAITVDPGLRDIHGQEMTSPWKGAVKTAPYEPELEIVDGVYDPAVLERGSARTLALRVAGLDEVEVRSRALTAPELDDFLGNRWFDVEAGWPSGMPPATGSETHPTPASKRLPERVDLDLRRLLEPGKVLFLSARSNPFTRWGYRQRIGFGRFVEVTDLGVTAALDRGRGTILVTSIEGGEPLEGVELELRARANDRPLWRGRSDARGLADLRFTGNVDYDAYVLARRGDDLAYLPLERDISGSWWGGGAGEEEPRAFFYTDRQLYKPGETVHLSGILRREGPGPEGGVDLWRTGFTARYTVTGPRGHTVAEGDATIGALGTFSVDVAIPEGADLGDHQVNLSVSGGWFGSARDFYHSFAVESYRAPEFEVAVERLEASPLVFGDLLKAEIQGRYLHGAPLVGGEVRYTMRRQESGYTPPGPENEGFSFGQRWTSPWGWRGWEIGPGSGGGILVAEGEGALDARGVFAVEHAVKAVEQDLHAPKGTTPAKGDAPEAATYTLEASVTDQNRQAIAGRSSFVVHPALRYVGVRADRNVYRAGERARLEAVVVDLDGKRIADAPVTIELVREETKRRAIEREGRWVYEYSTEEIAAGGCSPVSAAAPVGCELDLSKPGTYRARASVRDDAGRQAQSARTFYVYGEDATVWEQDERRVDLVPDRRRYEPGETATLLVRAPFDRAHGMVVIERDGIAETRPITVEGGSATIEVKIGAAMIPNLHVGVVLDRGRVEVPGAPPEQDLGRPAQAFGTIELEVSPESKRVVVELDPDRTELAPKETLRLRLKTRTSGGEALPAALAVMVVDEGVLSLIGYQTPDPLAFFHRKRSPGARVFDLRSYLLRRQDVEPPQGNEQSENQKAPEEPMAEAEYAPPPAPGASAADRAEGGAKFAEEKASPAKPKPVLSRAANKDATTALALGGEAGAASEVSLRTLFATTAYFNPEVRTDERGEATIEIPMPENLTSFRVMAVAVDPAVADRFGSADTRVRVRKPIMLRPSLPRFANLGDRFEAAVMVDNQSGADQAIQVGVRGLGIALDGAERTSVEIPAGESREVRFPMHVDAVGRARLQFAALASAGRDATEVTFPIQLPATRQAFADYGVTDSSVARLIKAPMDALPGFGGLELALSSTALSGLEDAARYLLDYDYECSEQTASRLLPIFVLGPILEGFAITDGAGAERRQAIGKAGIARILARQNWDGGFRLWDTPSRSWPYVSAWVTFALIEGKNAGFEVDARALDRALDYLGSYLRDEEVTPWGRYYDWSSRAFALWLLSREGRGSEHFARVWAHRADLPLYAEGWMLSAARRFGRDDVVERLRGELLARATFDAKVAHFVEGRSEDLADGLQLLMHSNVQTDAILLQALLEVAPEEPLLPKVMAGIMAERDLRDGGRWPTTHANAWALLAANRYFTTVEKETPDFVARIFLDQGFAGAQEFRGRSLAVSEQKIGMRRLQEAPEQTLTLAKEGPGKLYYRIGLRYAPADLTMKAEDQGFVVYRSYEAVAQGGGAVDPDAVRRLEDGTWEIKAGTLVKVDLTIVVRDRATYVVVDDPLPAGLEGQNPRFQTTLQDVGGAYGAGGGGALGSLFGAVSRGGYDAWWYPWWSWDHVELRDDRLLLFADRLPAGVYTYSYLAQATTIGEFTLPPIHAEGMYTPERFGHSASARVRVIE